jgi:hypothetical protein
MRTLGAAAVGAGLMLTFATMAGAQANQGGASKKKKSKRRTEGGASE